MLATFSVAETALSLPEIAASGKAATVYIENGDRSGSGFVVDESGLVITNQHVLGSAKKATLVLNSGTPDQKRMIGKVLRVDKERDLALLKVDGTSKLPKLALGTTERLGELTELVVCGFPFGKALSADQKNDPEISINVGSVTSLRYKNEALHRIQLDAAVNPGNSGGPVLANDGRVVGMIVSAIRPEFGSRVSLAIPVEHIQQFLTRPIITLTGPDWNAIQSGNPVELEATVVSILNDKPVVVEVEISFEDGTTRRFQMDRTTNAYRLMVSPPEKKDQEPRVDVSAEFGVDRVNGSCSDLKLSAAGETYLMSEVHSVTKDDTWKIVLRSGKTITSRTLSIPEAEILIDRQSIAFDLTQAKHVKFVPTNQSPGWHCTVIVSHEDEEIARLTEIVGAQGGPLPPLETLRETGFIKPAIAASPTTYLHVKSSEGDYIGAGKAYSYESDELKVTGSPRLVTARAGGWSLLLSPKNGEELTTKQYDDASRHPFNGNTPGLSFSGNGRGCNRLSGAFVIWELKVVDGKIEAAAIDFVQQCERTGPPLYGRLRYRSSFK